MVSCISGLMSRLQCKVSKLVLLHQVLLHEIVLVLWLMAACDSWEAADVSELSIFKSMLCVPERLQLACAGLARITLFNTVCLCLQCCALKTVLRVECLCSLPFAVWLKV